MSASIVSLVVAVMYGAVVGALAQVQSTLQSILRSALPTRYIHRPDVDAESKLSNSQRVELTALRGRYFELELGESQTAGTADLFRSGSAGRAYVVTFWSVGVLGILLIPVVIWGPVRFGLRDWAALVGSATVTALIVGRFLSGRLGKPQGSDSALPPAVPSIDPMDRHAQTTIGAEDLRRGFQELDRLGELDYGLDLLSLLPRDGQDEVRLARIGRLLGVALKEPFATAAPIVGPSDGSLAGAGHSQSWQFKAYVDDDAGDLLKSADDLKHLLESKKTKSTWQYGVLESLREERQSFAVTELAYYDWVGVRGFFEYLAGSVNKWTCNDPGVHAKIEAAVEDIRNAGGLAQVINLDGQPGPAVLDLATILTEHVPWLSAATAPLVAGFVIIIATLGPDGYCRWSRERAAVDTHEAK